MLRIVGQILSGTHKDKHGERITVENLKSLCKELANRKHPLYKQHDTRQPPSGFYENVRIEEDRLCQGEWHLKGDVTIFDDADIDSMKGFSISFTESVFEPDDSELCLYLPYPAYNDEVLLSEIAAVPRVSIARIKRKSEAASYGALLTVAIMITQPAWELVLHDQVIPSLERFNKYLAGQLKSRNIPYEIRLPVLVGGAETQLIFQARDVDGSPEQGIDSMNEAVRDAMTYLLDEARASEVAAVSRIYFVWDEGTKRYNMFDVHWYEPIVT